MRVAYPGAEGAFSHEACLRFLHEHEPVAVLSFADVVEAVESGQAELGMLPIHNNEAGETGARSLIDKTYLRILDERVLPVRMHLLGLSEAKLDQIQTVVSHPIALRQCARTLADLGVATEEASNTALAAKSLKDPDRGVLASEAAARIYELAILMRDVHDRRDNATRFAIVARNGA